MNSQLAASSALGFQAGALPGEVPLASESCPAPGASLALVPVPAPDLPHRASHGSTPQFMPAGSLGPGNTSHGAGEHQPWGQGTPAVGQLAPALLTLPAPKAYVLLQSLLPADGNGQQPLAEKQRGASGSTASAVGSAGPAQGHLRCPSRASRFPRRNSGRSLTCCRFTARFASY